MITSGFLRVSLRHWRYKLSTSFCRPDRRAMVSFSGGADFFDFNWMWSGWPRECLLLIKLSCVDSEVFGGWAG